MLAREHSGGSRALAGATLPSAINNQERGGVISRRKGLTMGTTRLSSTNIPHIYLSLSFLNEVLVFALSSVCRPLHLSYRLAKSLNSNPSWQRLSRSRSSSTLRDMLCCPLFSTDVMHLQLAVVNTSRSATCYEHLWFHPSLSEWHSFDDGRRSPHLFALQETLRRIAPIRSCIVPAGCRL